MPTPEQKKELLSYLRKRFSYIDKYLTSSETFFKDEKQRYIEQAMPGGELTPEIQVVLHDIEYGLATTFRYCFLVAVCSFVEDSLKKLGGLIVPDYDQKIKKGHSHDSWLKKHLKVFQSELGTDVTIINDEINLFMDIITVRNSIVHAWGKVDVTSNSSKLKGIISKYRNKGEDEWFTKTADGYIYIGHAVVVEAIMAAQKIVQHMLDKTPEN